MGCGSIVSSVFKALLSCVCLPCTCTLCVPVWELGTVLYHNSVPKTSAVLLLVCSVHAQVRCKLDLHQVTHNLGVLFSRPLSSGISPMFSGKGPLLSVTFTRKDGSTRLYHDNHVYFFVLQSTLGIKHISY